MTQTSCRTVNRREEARHRGRGSSRVGDDSHRCGIDGADLGCVNVDVNDGGVSLKKRIALCGELRESAPCGQEHVGLSDGPLRHVVGAIAERSYVARVLVRESALT